MQFALLIIMLNVILCFSVLGEECLKITFLESLTLSQPNSNSLSRQCAFLGENGQGLRSIGPLEPIVGFSQPQNSADFNVKVLLNINFASLKERPFWSNSYTIHKGESILLCNISYTSSTFRSEPILLSRGSFPTYKKTYGQLSYLSYLSFKAVIPDWENAMTIDENKSWISSIVIFATAGKNLDLNSLPSMKETLIQKAFGNNVNAKIIERNTDLN